MRIRYLQQGLEILAPAKVNLFLEILGKRADGFHELETLMCPISLVDRVRIQPAKHSDIRLTLSLPHRHAADARVGTENEKLEPPADPAWEIPQENNLVVRAAELVRKAVGTRLGCDILLEKQIPAAAGLGGGSSDAAAVVVGCLALWQEFDRELAHRICAELGSDIPFFLGDKSGCGLQLATGRGEICEVVHAKPKCQFVVTHPPAGCSTRQIYEDFRKETGNRHSSEIVQACEDGQFQKIGAAMFNALQSTASRVSPWIETQLSLLRRLSPHVLMSGSGSSCFALLAAGASLNRPRESFIEEVIQSGIERVYEVESFYCPSIESQLTGGPKQ